MTKLSEKLLETLRWQALSLDFSPKCDECYATHQGALKINEFEIKCYKGSDGSIAVDVEDIERFFRGCPNCTMPSECRHCNHMEDHLDRPHIGIPLDTDDL